MSEGRASGGDGGADLHAGTVDDLARTAAAKQGGLPDNVGRCATDSYVQVAYAVDDVVAAAEMWVAQGVGPFFVREHIPVTNSRVHGVERDFDHSSAYSQWGDLMVELICEHHPDGDRVGPATGVHHMALFVDNVDESQALFIERGWPEALFARAGKTQFAMHDARAELGHLVEIYQDTPALLGFYDMVRDAASGWDGTTDAIRFL